jgi:hypothetical protein
MKAPSVLISISVLAAIFYLSAPAAARAQGTSCAAPTFLEADGSTVTGTINNLVTNYFEFLTTAGSQYVVELTDPNDPMAINPGTLTGYVDVGSCLTTLTVAHNSGVDPKIQQGDRISFTAPGIQVEFGFSNTSGSAARFKVKVVETTMVSTAWSTNGTYDTFYSLVNTTNASIGGTLFLFDTTGTQVAMAPITAPVHGTAATNTMALGAPRNKAGIAIFTHTGPPGAILADAAIANFTITPPYNQPVKFAQVSR